MKSLPPSIRKSAEEAHAANPDATVTVVDATTGIVLYLSPNAKQINGVEPHEMVGRHYWEFVDKLDSENLKLKMQDALLTGESVMAARTIISPSGGRQRMRAFGKKLVDPGSGAVYVMSISRRAE